MNGAVMIDLTPLLPLADPNGGLAGFAKFSSQKENQAKIQSQHADLDRLAKELGDLENNRATAFARFQWRAGI
jgi:hypothetical protein